MEYMEYHKKYYKYKIKYLNLKGGSKCNDLLKKINENILDRTDINKLKVMHALTVFLSRKKGEDPECDKLISLIEQLIHDTNIDDNTKISYLRTIATSINKSTSSNVSIPIKLTSRVSPKQPTLTPPPTPPALQPPLAVQPSLAPKQLVVSVPIETNIELYTPVLGGESSNIWPIISNTYKKSNRLGIKGITDPTLNFRFIEKHSGRTDVPIFGRGTFTAVYQIKNELNKADTIIYILRIFERKTYVFPNHFMRNPKIISEYIRYNEYLIRIYYFGELQILANQFEYIDGLAFDGVSHDSDKDNYNILPTTVNYNFDYTITKLYNVPKYDNYISIINLNNSEKFKFLYNNVVMLKKLADNNEFHADYKIDNVGWDDPIKLNVIMIDYDDETIQEASNKNKNLHLLPNNKIDLIFFSSTYIPEYLKNKNICTLPDNSQKIGYPCVLPNYAPEQFVKYSIGGLYNIIQSLNIKFNVPNIDIPLSLSITKRRIRKINTNDLAAALQLNNIDYESIPTYEEIIDLFDHIRVSNYIS